MTSRLPRLLPAVAALAVAAAFLSAGAGASQQRTGWSRISGPKGAGQQLGLARTGDGVLHVIWNRGNPAPTSIFETRLSPTGATLGTSTVRTNWGGAGGLALLTMPDGSLRLFATGAAVNGSPNGGVNTLTAPAGGQGWTLGQGQVWGGSPAAAAPFVGAALANGQPVTAWAGAGASNFQAGLPGGGSGTQLCACSDTSADVVADGGSGAVVVAGETIGNPAGTYVERALPGIANRHVLASATQTAGDEGIAARIGAPGVYVAWTDGNRPGVAKPAAHLSQYGGATRTLAAGPFTVAKAFAGPAGRLWVAWGDKDGVFVTRTNRAAGRFEPVQKLAPPPGAGFLWNAEGEGSAGPLDLFVDADTPDGRGFWHAHLLARFSLSAHAKRTRSGATVTLAVADAGDPVAGASIAVGGRHVKTDASGHATVALPHGSYAATATAAGYAPASARFGA